MCSASSLCGYLIYTYVLPVTLIFVSLMTGLHVRAWTVYHPCVCLCYSLIRVSCLFTSPFVPFKSRIMIRLLRVRPSQKLLYENLPVHGRNVMVRQLRVEQGRVMTCTFLTGEGRAALLKNRQGRTDRTRHRRAIFRITRNSKNIDIALATLTVWELYAKATRSKCMLNY